MSQQPQDPQQPIQTTTQAPQSGHEAYSDTPARRAKGKWGGGAKALTWIGAVLLALGVGAGVFGGIGFVGLLPTGLIGAGGQPGEEALAGGDVPGSAVVNAEQGDVIVIWEVAPSGSTYVMTRDDVQVSSPLDDVHVAAAEISGSTESGGYRAHTVAQFVAHETGEYTVEVGGSADKFILAEGERLPGFMSGIFSAIALWFAAIALSVTGFALLLAGVIWGMVRARR